MPELPEVEVLLRHLAPRLEGRTIREVEVLARGSLRPPKPLPFSRALKGARFQSAQRRGKYLVFSMRGKDRNHSLIVHLGMTGRLYLADKRIPVSRHARVMLDLGPEHLVFEDVRRFGGMSLQASAVDRLGPEPLEPGFTTALFHRSLSISRQPVKVRLLDQSVVAGIGNIYAGEALFLARIDPRQPSCALDRPAVRRLRNAIRRVLRQAIRFGSTVPLAFGGAAATAGLFYYGQSPTDTGRYEERLRVYGREGQRCRRCRTTLRKIAQAGRSTVFCPNCQR